MRSDCAHDWLVLPDCGQQAPYSRSMEYEDPALEPMEDDAREDDAGEEAASEDEEDEDDEEDDDEEEDGLDGSEPYAQ